MSNPDSTGPYWQDEPERANGSAAYRDGDGYDQSPDGWPGEWTRGYSATPDGGAANGRRGRREQRHNGGRSARSARRSRGYDPEGHDRAGYDAAGYDRAGYDTGGYDAAGYRGNGYRGNGYGAADTGYGGADTGYGGYHSGSAGYGYGTDEYGGRRSGYRGGTGLADDDLVALPGGGGGGDGWGPAGPDGPDDGDGGPGGLVGPGRRRTRAPGGPRRPGSWWRHWTPKKAALVMGCMALGMVLVLIAGFFYVYSTVQLPLQKLSAPLIQSSIVYYADGKTEVGCFCSKNRTVLSATELASDKYLEQAFFAAEDRHYLTEGGISLTGTARAILVDLTGKGYQGGSTITEQFVKTYFDPSGLGNLTYKDKLKEIIDAIKLARIKDKQWILSHYLNAIYLGSGAYGVEAAAETYFGVHASQVGIAQAAMLAAMVQLPSAFNPAHPATVVPGVGYSLLGRWVYTLVNMARDTYPDGTPVITQQQLHALVPDPNNINADLKNFPKITPSRSDVASWSGARGYIMQAVENELENTYHLKASLIGSLGLHIVTTVDRRKMKALYSAVHEAKKTMAQYGVPLPWYAHIGAILENPKTGAIEASYGGPNWNTKHCVKLYCHYDMAMQARNQVGSSFKPYVLAAAVKKGMNVQTSVLNGYSPLCVPPETQAMTLSKRGSASSCVKDGVGWLPVGYDPVVEGPTTVAKAAALSSNAAFEDLAHRVGTQPIIRLAKSFGVNIGHAPSKVYPHGDGSGLRDDIGKIGIALGIAPLTVEEQATFFATLADNGVYHTPHVIAKITGPGRNIKIKIKTHPVLTPAQVADVDWALSFDTVYGTGVPNAVLSPSRPTIAKTGTTDVAQSAFFIGALPEQYSFAVGMFTNSQNDTTGGQTLDVLPSVGGTGGGFGGAWPATIWRLYMTKLLAMRNLPVAQLNPLQLTGFQKWVQAHKPKPKCNQGPGNGNGGPGNGNGPGNGHGHGHFAPAAAIKPFKCPSPSPSPSPSGSPSPLPSGSPSPLPSGSPSPSASPPTGPAQPAHAPSRKSAAGTPSLTTSATLPRPAFVPPVTAPRTTGLV